MKKRILWMLLAIVMVLGMLPGFALTASAATITPVQPAGAGTENDPYKIGTAAELYWYANSVNSNATVRKSYAILTANIIVNTNVLKTDGTLSENEYSFETWPAIGNAFGTAYTGHFDGKGYTISGLYLVRDPKSACYVGLIGHAGDGAVIKNVTVEDSYFSGMSGIGGIIGETESGSTVTVENCHNGATVVSHTIGNGGYAGGIIGHVSTANLKDCTSHGVICVNTDYAPTQNETSRAGGIVGSGSTVTFENCHNSNSVTGVSYVGGVVGYVGKVTMTKCSNTGNITGNALEGMANTGKYIGGIIGYINTTTECEIKDCYNAGSLQAYQAGGIVGGWFNAKKITNCHSYGAVNATTVNPIAPNSDKNSTNSYYLDTITNKGENTAKSATEFANGNVVALLNGSRTGADAVWTQGGYYPVFKTAHIHTWNYTATDSTTITAKCTAPGCDLTDGNGGTVTIAAPKQSNCFLNENNAPIAAVVTNALVDATTTVNVVYCKSGETTPLTGAPTAAGTYTASITLGAATISVEYNLFRVTEIVIDTNSPAYEAPAYEGAPGTFYVSDQFPLYFRILGENFGKLNPKEAQLWSRDPDKGGYNFGVTYQSDTLLTGYVDEFRLYNALTFASPKSAYAQLGLGNMTHRCILKEAPEYAVNYSVGANGMVYDDIASNLSQAPEHASITLTITPDTGYALDTLTVNGQDVTAQVSGGTYTFTMPARAITISATFKASHTHSLSGTGNSLTWTPITSLSDITGAGNYYLSGDITSNTSWTVNNDVNLCLNGHELLFTSTVSGKYITVNSGASLSICDCSAGQGGCVHTNKGSYTINNKGTVNLYSGTIDYTAPNSHIAAIENCAGAILNVYGGKIDSVSKAIRNKGTVNISGGTVTAKNDAIQQDDGELTISGGTVTTADTSTWATINFYGGTMNITGGTITHGGGRLPVQVPASAKGSISISDGTIATAGKYNAFYLASSNVDVSITGGSITTSSTSASYASSARYGWAIDVVAAKSLNISGSPVINRIYLDVGNTITIGAGGLNVASPIELHCAACPAAVTGQNSADYSSCFTPRNGSFIIKNKDNVVWFTQTAVVTYTDGVDGEEIFADQSYPSYLGADTPDFVGTPSRTGYTFNGWSPILSDTVDADVTYTAQWTVNQYDATFLSGDGKFADGSTSKEIMVNFGETPVAPEEPTKAGYGFTGWTPTLAPMVTTGATYTATYAAGVSNYTVKTYTMGLDGQYGTPISETKFGATDSTADAAATAPAGFSLDTAQSKTSGKVTADGKLVLEVYFSRNLYQLTFDANGGTGGTTAKVYFGAPITAPTVTKPGYSYVWNTQVPATMPAESLTFTAQWAEKGDTPYTVYHWQQKLDGGDELNDTNFHKADTENLTGVTDSDVTPAIKTYEGFAAPAAQTVTIAGDGSTVVNYYYTRNSYLLTLKPANGQSDMSISVKFGASISVPVPSRGGCTFAGWLPALPATMPASSVTAVAQWTQITYPLTVIDGTGSGNYAENALVTITANAPESGMIFDKWVVTAGNVQLDETQETVSFIMPNTPVTITATYKRCANPALSNLNLNWMLVALYNQEFEIVANAAEGGTITPDGVSFVKYKQNITYTITPAEGFAIADVLVDGESVGAVSEYTFKRVKDDHTISATFIRTAWVNPFADINENDWFYADIEFVCKNGLMATNGSSFSPDAGITRAEFVSILWQLEDSPVVSSAMDIFDVSADAPYAGAIYWASVNSIILGNVNGTVSPNELLTREQIAAILHRYAICKGWDDGITFPMIPQYTYSAWAETHVIWADRFGLHDGIGTDSRDLTKEATRAESAAYLRRFCERFVEEYVR